ncbi:hypothetical protein ElyMa_005950900 [Elysia marginata]|uniref:Uncharacterized protein n=1 Tax=Elysia marginata TaxID=1093978 RepID=A0AAV4G9W9_9GAST|nr:hypothetical protein ElyMa_005950900 [Elysia marginata]
MRRVLKSVGVPIASQRAERNAASELIGNDVTITDSDTLFTTDEDVVEKPMVTLTNTKLTTLLESQKESLTLHDGAILMTKKVDLNYKRLQSTQSQYTSHGVPFFDVGLFFTERLI